MVKRLAELAASIADLAGSPQDVEWSFDGRDVHVLQARPITALAGRQVYSRRMVSDMAPGLANRSSGRPMHAPINENVFAPIFESVTGPGTVDAAAISARFYSRVYVNVTTVGGILTRIGLPPNFFDMLAREPGRADEFRPNARTLLAAFRLGRFVRRESGIDRRVGPFLESQEERQLDAFRAVDWASRGPGDPRRLHFARMKTLHGSARSATSCWCRSTCTCATACSARMITRRFPGIDPREVVTGYGRRSECFSPSEEIERAGRRSEEPSIAGLLETHGERRRRGTLGRTRRVGAGPQAPGRVPGVHGPVRLPQRQRQRLLRAALDRAPAHGLARRRAPGAGPRDAPGPAAPPGPIARPCCARCAPVSGRSGAASSAGCTLRRSASCTAGSGSAC
ncbi:MAG: hypothetical protein MZV64_42755 [Ignavibacteriales bacterium]|nr:hypothetical protein [Ignavibacteriales bacterium]